MKKITLAMFLMLAASSVFAEIKKEQCQGTITSNSIEDKITYSITTDSDTYTFNEKYNKKLAKLVDKKVVLKGDLETETNEIIKVTSCKVVKEKKTK